MIESLKIENLILVEKADIEFGPGLNILTGETGSGKSAILSAIRLLLGDRAEGHLIRKGADLAAIEAVVRVPHTLIEGLELPPSGSPIHLRRELQKSGKSRYFVEDQLVTLAQVKQLLGRAIELVDQSSSISLSQSEEQRYILDTFASLLPQVEELRLSVEQEREWEGKLGQLIALEQTGARDQERWREDLDFIEEVAWEKGEEEALDAEHRLLTHAQELLEKVGAVSAYLAESNQLKRFAYQIEGLVAIDPNLKESASLLKNGALELEEASHLLASYLDRLEANPNRLVAIETRMGQIESLKKRFAPTYEALSEVKQKLTSQINLHQNLDEEIEKTGTFLASIKAKNITLANKLSQKRERASYLLSETVMKELKHLNLPQARFTVSLEPKPLGPTGINQVLFLFAANPGQPLVALDESASGGELSRLLFALKVALADKENSSCLIFDEIDSNVGGKTAAILGEKLKSLATTRQLICVTHFVQVARCAAHHFVVSKETTIEGATTTISRLIGKAQEAEFSRMTGQG